MSRSSFLISTLFFSIMLSACIQTPTPTTQVLSPLSEPQLTQHQHSTIVIAHRGASGYLPEHTLEAATLAFMQGADYIEQDLILTKDDVPIVLHDIHIDTVTNVEIMFPNRAREDGRYYAIDFTWEEIQQLFVHEREDLQGKQVYPSRYQGNGSFKVASLKQHIQLIKNLNQQFDQGVGYYPEIKAPEWHLNEGKDITAIVFEQLHQEGLTTADANIFIQSFFPGTLKRLRKDFGVEAKLVQLIAENDWNESSTDYTWLKSETGLASIALYADGIGPWIPQLVTQDAEASELLKNAKALGLLVHPYTFRNDDVVVMDNPDALLDLLVSYLKVDGVFSDHSDVVLHYLGRDITEQSKTQEPAE